MKGCISEGELYETVREGGSDAGESTLAGAGRDLRFHLIQCPVIGVKGPNRRHLPPDPPLPPASCCLRSLSPSGPFLDISQSPSLPRSAARQPRGLHTSLLPGQDRDLSSPSRRAGREADPQPGSHHQGKKHNRRPSLTGEGTGAVSVTQPHPHPFALLSVSTQPLSPLCPYSPRTSQCNL